MTATVSTEAIGGVAWRLTHAVLVYQSVSGRAYATLHGVDEGKLLAGVPATKEATAQLARSLGAGATLTGFTPPNLLYLGTRSVLWWRPPSPSRMFFDTTGEAAGDQIQDKTGAALIGKRGGKTPQPGLVIGVGAGGWYVYAVPGHQRPGPGTKLLRSPYFNVWANGRICTGNVRLPDTLSTAALERYERAFFDSEFTHPNLRGKERLVKYEGGAYALWRDGLDGKWPPIRTLLAEDAWIDHEGFPVDCLIPQPLTLEQFAQRLEKGKDDDE